MPHRLALHATLGWDGNAYLARKMDQVRALRGMLGDFVIDSRMEEKIEHEQHFQNYHLSPAFPASGGCDSALRVECVKLLTAKDFRPKSE